jgi:hypothetical protein
MSEKAGSAARIIARTKGLAQHLQEGEVPLLSVPAFWDTGPEQSRTACDVIVTNQRIFGYYYRQFPREHLFLDALDVQKIKAATLREKEFEPVFREIRLNDGSRTVYIRAPRQKCESLYKTLHQVLTGVGSDTAEEAKNVTADNESVIEEGVGRSVVYDRQKIRREFNTSPLAVWLLFVGGIILEVLGIILWSNTQNITTGLPLFFAGFVAVAIGFWVRREGQRPK